MDDMTMSTPADLPLRRRNSTSKPVVVPTKLSLLPSETHHHHNYSFPSSTTASTITSATSPSSSTISHQSFPNVDFDLLSIKHISYTSLKDLLPSAAGQSPTTQSQSEISIRNRLVNRAAWAYLRPMLSTSPDSAGTNCFSALFSFVDRHIIRTITRFVDWLHRPFWIWSSR